MKKIKVSISSLALVMLFGLILGGVIGLSGAINPANIAFAQNQPTSGTYVPLAPLPNTGLNSGTTTTNFSSYVLGMFGLLIGAAAALAVIMIVIGGIQYMSTDAISGKSEGKERITDAIYGLLLAISCWLILNTVNPDILKFDILKDVQNTPSQQATTTEQSFKVRTCQTATSPTISKVIGQYSSPRECGDALPRTPGEDGGFTSICSVTHSITCALSRPVDQYFKVKTCARNQIEQVFSTQPYNTMEECNTALPTSGPYSNGQGDCRNYALACRNSSTFILQ